MPTCPDHFTIPVQYGLGLVFSPVYGVSGENETHFQPQTSLVIVVLDLSSLLFTYYRGEKREHVCIHTLFLLSQLQLWQMLLRLRKR